MEEEKVVDQTSVTPTEEAKAKRPFPPKGGKKPFKRSDREKRPARPVKEFEERLVYVNRISKTVKGGRKMRFSALVVIGDGKGRYGFSHAKANEVPDAIKKALDAAKKNVHTIEIVNGTIAHEVTGKFGACKVFLKPAPQGSGIIAGGPVRAILELAGIKNVYSKVYGSRTAINIVRSTHNGLKDLKSRKVVNALRHGQVGGNE